MTTCSNETIFDHNSDCSGNVTIWCSNGELEVPAEALLHFAAEHVRRRRIRQLEDASMDELLGTQE